MNAVTFDPAREVKFYFRCNRAGSITFTFVYSDGTPYSFIYTDDLEFNIYKNQGDKKKLISLNYISGLTISGNIVTTSITKALSNIPEGEYYAELYRTDLEKTWICGDAIFHNGKFDGVEQSNTITVNEGGDTVSITIDSVVNAATQAEVDAGVREDVYVNPKTFNDSEQIADLEQQIQAVVFNGNPYELYPENTSLIHGGYDGATTDTERTEVMQAWLTAGASPGATNQIILRTIRNKVYTINSGISATGCFVIDSPGIIRASADMASGTLVTLTISGSSASTFNKITLLRVDGFNSTNPNTIEGCRIVNGQGVSKGLIHVYRCGTGFKAHNNVEACDFHVMHDSCDIAVHMGGDGGGGTTGDENHFLITGVSSDTLWKQDNATKSSAVVKFASEGGGSTNAAIEMSGAARAVFSGEIRGARKLFRGGGASVTFDNLQYYTDGAAIGENTIEFDAASGMIDGSIRISSTTASGGIWIKACASGSSLCIKQDDQVTGFGLKLGEYNVVPELAKLVTSFTLTKESSIRVDGTNSFIDLDYATRCEINLSRIQGRATIGANSSLNELNIKAQSLTLVNNRVELDNIIRFNEILTPAQRDALASPIKGYRIKGINDSGMLVGEAHYNGSAWVQLG